MDCIGQFTVVLSIVARCRALKGEWNQAVQRSAAVSSGAIPPRLARLGNIVATVASSGGFRVVAVLAG